MGMIDFFSSPIGLGHITRDIAIAEHLNNISINFTTGSGAAKFLKNSNYTVNDAYTPPPFVVQQGKLQNSARWLWNYYQYYKDCKNISQKIIKQNKPDLLISDEDFASLSVAQNLKIPTILITDILQTRFTTGLAYLIEKKMNKSMQKIIKKCDLVILPEDGENLDNIHRVGPIVRHTNHSRQELRKKFSFNKKTILISIGGTDAGVFLIKQAIKAISKINCDVDTVLVSGPAINEEFDNVRNAGFVNNLHELIFASDLLISTAGKSTIDEASAYGTPAIFIPIKGHFEQEDNAAKLGFSFDDLASLDELILQKLDSPKNQIHTDGAKIASDLIKSLMDKKSNV